MKRIISMILSLAVIISLAQPISAAEASAAEPRYANATSTKVALTIDGKGAATIEFTCYGNSSLESAKVTTYFQQKIDGTWKTICSWSYSSTSTFFTKTYSTTITEHGEYRALSYFYLTGTTSETITGTDNQTY